MPYWMLVLALVFCLLVGIATGYAMKINERGKCKTYDVKESNQSVEICTRIIK